MIGPQAKCRTSYPRPPPSIRRPNSAGHRPCCVSSGGTMTTRCAVMGTVVLGALALGACGRGGSGNAQIGDRQTAVRAAVENAAHGRPVFVSADKEGERLWRQTREFYEARTVE